MGGLLEKLIELTGLPSVRAGTLIRKALHRDGVNPDSATEADVLRVLPDIQARLAAYMPADLALQRANLIHDLLAHGAQVTVPPPRLDDVIRQLRRTNQHLSSLDATRRSNRGEGER